MNLPLDNQGVDAGATPAKDNGGQSFNGATATPSEQIAAWGGIKGAEAEVDLVSEKTVKVWDDTNLDQI